MLFLVQMIIIGIAVWRLSYMLVEEEGPYEIFTRLRNWLGTDVDEDHRNQHLNTLRGILECIYCISVWLGFFFVAVYVISPLAAMYIALPFALSAIAIFLDKIHG